MFDRWITQVLAFLPSVLAAIVILLVGIGLAALARRLAGRGFRRLAPEARRVAGRVVYVVTLVVATLLALAVLGVHVAALATLLGALGLAISLSLQDVARNFVAGLYLLMEHPFDAGDRIIVRGAAGQVVFVGLRTTLLRGDDGAEIIVPNTVILSEVVVRPASGGRI